MKKNNRRKGVSLLEYGIIGSLVAVASILSISSFGIKISNLYCGISNIVLLGPWSSSQYSESTSCDKSLYYQELGLSPSATDEQVSQACSQKMSDSSEVTFGEGGCFTHFQQLKYNGDRESYMNSLSIPISDIVQASDSSDTANEKSEHADVIAMNACESKGYSGSLLSDCATSASAAISRTSFAPTLGWKTSMFNSP